MLVGVWQINTGVGETPVLSAFQSYAGNNSCTASNFIQPQLFRYGLLLTSFLFFRADGVDMDKEVGDTAVVDGDRITDVKIKRARAKRSFPSISQCCIDSHHVEEAC